MDTKWKNIKYNKATKTVAFLLAVLMFFLAGNFAGLFIKGFADFNIFAHPQDFTNTASFRMQMNAYILDVLNVAESKNMGSYEEWLKTERAENIAESFQNDMKSASEAAALLDKSGIKVYVDAQNRYRYSLDYSGVRYLFSYNGEYISSDQFNSYEFIEHYAVEPTGIVESSTAVIEPTDNTDVTQEVAVPENQSGVIYYDPYDSGGVPEYVNRISMALRRLDSYGEYTCYGECGIEEVLAVIESDKKDTLQIEYENVQSHSIHAHRNIEQVKNVNYAIIANNGRVFTNCGVDADDDHNMILAKLQGEEGWVWAEWVNNGKYSIIDVENEAATGIYATLHDWLFGTWYKESVLSWNTYTENKSYKAAYFVIDVPLETDSFYAIANSFDSYNKDASLTGLLFAFAVSFIFGCALCIYLLFVTGKNADGSVRIKFLDKVPFEINAVLVLALMFAAAVGAVGVVVCEFDPSVATHSGIGEFVILATCAFAPFSNVIIGVLAALFFMLWTGLTASIIRNIRNKTFHKHSLVCLIFKPVGWIFRKLWNRTKRIIDKIKYAFNCDYSKGQSTKFKVLACLAVSLFVVITGIYYFIVGGIMCSGDDFIAFMLYVIGALGDIAIAVFVIMLIVSLDRIMVAVSDIRKGEMGKGIDTKYMPPFMKRFAEDVLCMQDGLQNAVESAVKDQRMKAELITNVSHDLKTPLTSIVNYVDLLKKCEIQDETALKYVSVLDEKAHKMKKLIEDLVEASKASSGAMEIHTVKLNLCELAAQAVGEHEDELKKYGIELVLKIPDEPVMVTADAQKISRVIENLFSNIRKYALEGTRVYIDVAAGAEYGSVIFKNVSKNPLDISPEELTRRFVRGDASRSGEGSGLGLSIAKDLCELQNGKLGLQIDGDLFKAVVALPIA